MNNYRLIKYTQGSKTWYEIQEFNKFNCFDRWIYGYNGRWEICSDTIISGCGEIEEYLRYDDEDKARIRFSNIQQTWIDYICECKQEVLKEF